MTACNIDFFDQQTLECIWHDSADMPDIDDDYISATTSKVVIGKTTAVTNGAWIRFSGDFEWIGLVTEVDNTGTDQTTVSFKPFVARFDEDLIFDTRKQGGSTSLEAVIAQWFFARFVNVDTYQKLPLGFTTSSTTSNWGFNLKPSKEGSYFLATGAYKTLLVKAMTKYGIAVTPSFDFADKTISLNIRTYPDKIKIDADLDNVSIKTFDIHKSSQTVNKLVVWCYEDLASPVVYYLHPDETYDTTNASRITPVVQDEELTEYSGTDADSLSTADKIKKAAAAAASSKFSGTEWSSLIELECSVDDALLKPVAMPFGQQVVIYHDGASYPSILTGKAYKSGVCTLSFGTVRYDLIKRIKEGM